MSSLFTVKTLKTRECREVLAWSPLHDQWQIPGENRAPCRPLHMAAHKQQGRWEIVNELDFLPIFLKRKLRPLNRPLTSKVETSNGKCREETKWKLMKERSPRNSEWGIFVLFCFVLTLGTQLRAPCLQGKRSNQWVKPPAPRTRHFQRRVLAGKVKALI